jgi:hypothetical protein
MAAVMGANASQAKVMIGEMDPETCHATLKSIAVAHPQLWSRAVERCPLTEARTIEMLSDVKIDRGIREGVIKHAEILFCKE